MAFLPWLRRVGQWLYPPILAPVGIVGTTCSHCGYREPRRADTLCLISEPCISSHEEPGLNQHDLQPGEPDHSPLTRPYTMTFRCSKCGYPSIDFLTRVQMDYMLALGINVMPGVGNAVEDAMRKPYDQEKDNETA